MTVAGPALSGLGISLPNLDEVPVGVHLELARVAEDCGLDAVVAGEIAGPEVFALLGAISQNTTRVTLGTAVISTFTRSPALTAMGFSTLESLAPARVFAGVGSASPVIVRGWHGIEFERPLARATAFITDLRTALAGDRIGQTTDELGAPPFRVMPPRERHIPIVLAAMHPGMLRLSGALADGVMLAFCPPAELPGRIAIVREGAAAVGRDPSEVAITVSMDAYAGDHYDEVLVRLRRFILQYSVLPTHRESIKGSFPNIDAATEAWRAGDRRAALDWLDEAVVKRICAIGSGADVVGRVDELRAAGADLVVLHTLGRQVGDELSALQTVRAVGAALPA
jgi:alkanesulfonate monooxygenase SsuD/methylene tetrahydromethanopterin reductase-like flavin-dependent oxidoreductase (luciferase family)